MERTFATKFTWQKTFHSRTPYAHRAELHGAKTRHRIAARFLSVWLTEPPSQQQCGAPCLCCMSFDNSAWGRDGSAEVFVFSFKSANNRGGKKKKERETIRDWFQLATSKKMRQAFYLSFYIALTDGVFVQNTACQTKPSIYTACCF